MPRRGVGILVFPFVGVGIVNLITPEGGVIRLVVSLLHLPDLVVLEDIIIIK